MKGDRKYCSGCRDDFYNDRENFGRSKECWSLKTAKTVKRWQLAWWTAPTVPGALMQIRTNSCHHAPGRYALSEKLPSCAVDPEYMEKS